MWHSAVRYVVLTDVRMKLRNATEALRRFFERPYLGNVDWRGPWHLRPYENMSKRQRRRLRRRNYWAARIDSPAHARHLLADIEAQLHVPGLGYSGPVTSVSYGAAPIPATHCDFGGPDRTARLLIEPVLDYRGEVVGWSVGGPVQCACSAMLESHPHDEGCPLATPATPEAL